MHGFNLKLAEEIGMLLGSSRSKLLLITTTSHRFTTRQTNHRLDAKRTLVIVSVGVPYTVYLAISFLIRLGEVQGEVDDLEPKISRRCVGLPSQGLFRDVLDASTTTTSVGRWIGVRGVRVP